MSEAVDLAKDEWSVSGFGLKKLDIELVRLIERLLVDPSFVIPNKLQFSSPFSTRSIPFPNRIDSHFGGEFEIYTWVCWKDAFRA